MSSRDSMYLGFDLSTQQLKGVAVSSDLKVIHEARFDFDADSHGFSIHKGVLTNEDEREVYAPVELWLQALDRVLVMLKESGLDFAQVKGISGAGMQHGSVFWTAEAEGLLASLDPKKPLQKQLDKAFSYPFSPNWQDASTQKECDEFDVALGSEAELAQITGSKAHHRFTGPQILRFSRKHAEAYANTSRISLVSSFIASLFLGKIAPIDISDVCGMNLWDIKAGQWHRKLMALAAGAAADAESLIQKLGSVPEDGGSHLGPVSDYFVQRHGFKPDCVVIASTGDNPATIVSQPLRPNDAIVSLGTSTTFLMSTPEYKPDPATHFFNHPTTPGLYMFMLCYKNGGLAREQVRDAISGSTASWQDFDKHVLAMPPLGQASPGSPMTVGLFFPRPEIVPNLPSGEWHFNYDASHQTLDEVEKTTISAEKNARLIVESQFLSLRLRSEGLVRSPAPGLPPQPRRVYLVGGGSRNKAIAKVAGEILGGSEGVWKLDVGENACALGAAYKAVWAVEREKGQTFEDLIGRRWKESDFAEKIADGYQKGLWEKYGVALEGLRMMEEELLSRHT